MSIESELSALIAELGYTENPAMTGARQRLTEALMAHHKAVFVAALNEYLDLAWAWADALPDAATQLRGRISVGLNLALLRYQAGHIEELLRELDDAFDQATNHGFDDITERLAGLFRSLQDTPAYLLLRRADRTADIARYRQQEQIPGLSVKARGLILFRLAQAYLALIELGTDDPAALRALLNGAVESALLHLEGLPDQAEVLAFQEALAPDLA